MRWRCRSVTHVLGVLTGLLTLLQCSAPEQRPVRNAWDPGPPIGTVLPPFQALDQHGRLQTLASLRGPSGLLLNFNRSAVW